MPEDIALEDYKKTYRGVVVEEEKRGFLIHLVVYVLINSLLIVMNFLYSPEVIWFIYPLLAGGIGITAHYLGAVRWIEKDLMDKEVKAEYRAIQAKKK